MENKEKKRTALAPLSGPSQKKIGALGSVEILEELQPQKKIEENSGK